MLTNMIEKYFGYLLQNILRKTIDENLRAEYSLYIEIYVIQHTDTVLSLGLSRACMDI